MSAFIDENQQFQNAAGLPITGGMLYIGLQGADPILNPITIYSDRALTVPIANPQTLNAEGRAPVKIWIPATYSMQVNDLLAVQQLIDLDAGATESIGNTNLTNAAGTNTITATGGVAAYIDGQVYIFKAVNQNTAAVTLNIDGVGAKAIVKSVAIPLIAGQIEANKTISVIYNSTSDNFTIVNSAASFEADQKGADIASTAALTLGIDGNYFDVTGTVSITSIVTRGIGFVVRLHFDAILTLTNSAADLILPGGQNIVTAAGDEATFIEYATGDWRCVHYQRAIGVNTSPFLAVDKRFWPTTAPAADAAHDITFSAGVIADSTGLSFLNLASTLVKQLDVDWAAGTGAGGFPSGLTLAADTSYHMFLIGQADGTVDAGFDTSLTATNLLSDATGYTFYRRVGSGHTDGSSNWLNFIQTGDEWQFVTPPLDINAGQSTSRVLRTLSMPIGIKLMAKLRVHLTSADAYIISDPDETDAAVTTGGTPLSSGDGDSRGDIWVMTDLVSQVAVRGSATNTLLIVTYGWTDPRES